MCKNINKGIGAHPLQGDLMGEIASFLGARSLSGVNDPELAMTLYMTIAAIPNLESNQSLRQNL